MIFHNYQSEVGDFDFRGQFLVSVSHFTVFFCVCQSLEIKKKDSKMFEDQKPIICNAILKFSEKERLNSNCYEENF